MPPDRLGAAAALVTGAAGGIGRSIALELAAAGHPVAVADRLEAVEQTAAEIRSTGGISTSAVFDISDPLAVRHGIQGLSNQLGPLTVLVANAGIVDQLASADRFSVEGWESELRVNLSGAFWCVQAVLPDMRMAGWGRIVVISSSAALLGLPGQVAYSSTKAGLIGMVRTLAVEVARDEITCNAILPGMIATEKAMMMPQAVRRRYLERIPLARFGDPKEVAAMVTFLVSMSAAYVTGAAIPVDGGFGLNTIGLGSRQ